MDLLPALRTDKLLVVLAPQAAREESMTLIAELALRNAVTVLDGGNRFNAYQVTRHLRRKTVGISIASSRLFIRRAFTCYEMDTLIADTPSLAYPTIILDLLHTFYDDHTSAQESCRLLDSCIRQIRRLQTSAPVTVTLAPPTTKERAFLIDRVCEAADQVYTPELPAEEMIQLPLF